MNMKKLFLLAAVLAALGSSLADRAMAQTFTILHSFAGFEVNGDGSDPVAGLIQSGATLYGTASAGGVAGLGTVFGINPDGTGFTNVYGFNGGSDGAHPQGGLVLSGNTLYGTTEYGGNGVDEYYPSSGNGTVFKVNTDGSGFAILYAFTAYPTYSYPYLNSDGANPMAGLVLSGNTLYGTTQYGGTNGYGAIFAVNTDGTGFTNLYNFTCGDDGGNPVAGLILAGNILYGTAENGGAGGWDSGAVFQINTDGSGYTNFLPAGTDIHEPVAGLVLSGGTLYGTDWGASTIFSIGTNGADLMPDLYDFTAPEINSSTIQTNSDGFAPVAGLLLAGDTLYGTASQGGTNGSGTVFGVGTNGNNFTNLFNFVAVHNNHSGIGTNSSGADPVAGLVLAGNTLFGTASAGGAAGNGTVFAVNPDGSGFTNCHDFAAFTVDCYYPEAGLVLAGNTLYGTANQGGPPPGKGAVFALNTDGSGYVILHSFTNVDGTFPIAGLALSGDTLYGTANAGGTNGYGAIFKVNTDGSNFEKLFSFPVELTPQVGLVVSGNLCYGTADYADGGGIVYAIHTDGTGFTNLCFFDGDSASGLVLSGNTLYGTIETGVGDSGGGSVFAVNTDGSNYTNLYIFTATSGTDDTNSDGATPEAGVILSGNTLYGTASAGGLNGSGTVFALQTDGSGFTNLYSFSPPATMTFDPITLGFDDTTNFDGVNPVSALVLSGGTLYGTASGGGVNGDGTVFAINTDGSNFTSYPLTSDNTDPVAGLVVSGNTLYGTAKTGGGWGYGTVFSLALGSAVSPPPPPPTPAVITGISL